MRANWFIGLPCPAGHWFETLIAGHPPPPRVRVFAPGDLHFTVAFLGEVDECAARAAFAQHHRWPSGAIDATLGAVKPMGPRRRFSALSALLDDGREAVEAGMAACCNPMRAVAGLRHESRKPLAHLTLARPQRRADERERAAALEWAKNLPVAGQALRLAELALYTWSEDRREQLFRIVARAGLEDCERREV